MSKLTITSPIGTARFPHLNEPDTKFDAEGKYKVDLVITAEEAQAISADIEAARPDEFAASEPGNRCVRQVEDKEGNPIWILRASTKHAPRIVDAAKKLTDVRIGGGSRLRLACNVVPVTVRGTTYISAYLNAVQVVELSEGASSFDEIEGGFVDAGAGDSGNGDF